MAPIGVPSSSRGGAFRRHGWKGIAITSLVVSGLGVGPIAVAATGTPDAVVRVRVTDAHGAPLRHARVVTTVLWTSKADYERFGRASSRLGRTNEMGTLDVALRLTAHERSAVARNGDWLNLSLVAVDDRGVVVSSTAATRYIGANDDERRKAAKLANHDLVRMSASGASRAPKVESAGATAATTSTSCTYYWEAASYALRYAQVGELHVDYDVTYARFTYGRTADTTFDVAVKSSGSDWMLSGSVHLANSLDASVYANAGGQTNYHWALRSQFRFVNVRLYKDCVGGPYHFWTGSEQWIAVEWTGGGMTLANTLTQPARSAANTWTFGPHTGWSRAASRLVKWTAAVSIFGVTVGAQSGASANVKIEYTFGGRPTHYLYGDTGLPGSSKRVFQDT